MGRYRKRPVEIEANQWDGTHEEAARIIAWVAETKGVARHYPEPNPHIAIHTLEGAMLARPGDWIVRGVREEHYPVKRDIFEESYEEVPNGVATDG